MNTTCVELKMIKIIDTLLEQPGANEKDLLNQREMYLNLLKKN